MLEVESRLIKPAMEELAINFIDDLPDQSVLPPTLKNATKKENKAFLEKLSTAAVDNYVLRKEKIDQLPQVTRNAQNYESREREECLMMGDSSAAFKDVARPID